MTVSAGTSDGFGPKSAVISEITKEGRNLACKTSLQGVIEVFILRGGSSLRSDRVL